MSLLDFLVYVTSFTGIAGFAGFLALRHIRRKREVARGLRCWNCGQDLRQTPRAAGARHSPVCPNCGDWVDADPFDDDN